jgi:hypothetical protein
MVTKCSSTFLIDALLTSSMQPTAMRVFCPEMEETVNNDSQISLLVTKRVDYSAVLELWICKKTKWVMTSQNKYWGIIAAKLQNKWVSALLQYSTLKTLKLCYLGSGLVISCVRLSAELTLYNGSGSALLFAG